MFVVSLYLLLLMCSSVGVFLYLHLVSISLEYWRPRSLRVYFEKSLFYFILIESILVNVLFYFRNCFHSVVQQDTIYSGVSCWKKTFFFKIKAHVKCWRNKIRCVKSVIYYLQFHIYQAPTNCLYGLHQELADHYVIISFSPVYADKLPLEHCLFGSICGMHCTM